MPYALITGASKGIGKAIAYELAAHGFDLLIASRSEELLRSTAAEVAKAHPVKVHYLSVDLSEPGAVKKIAAWCADNSYEVSALVNNAGYGIWGYKK